MTESLRRASAAPALIPAAPALIPAAPALIPAAPALIPAAPAFLTALPVRVLTQAVEAVVEAAAAVTEAPKGRKSAEFEPAAGLKFADTPAPSAKSSDFSRNAVALFDRIDRDDDGYLSHGEINRAMHDASFKGAEAGTVVALNKMVDDLEELSNDEWGDEDDGVTRADLRDYDTLGTDSKLHAKTEGYFTDSQQQVKDTNRSLFPAGRASITAAAVDQGYTGDCYFLAAVAGVAHTNPAAIENMIRDNGNGTYSVTFPGRKAVTVDAPTDAELGRGATGHEHGIWVTVLEKAYARVSSSSTSYKAIEGGYADQGIKVMTGKASGYSSWILNALGEDLVGDMLKLNLAKKQVITVSTPGSGKKMSQAGIVSSHVYTVMGYDPATKTVTLRNPWGNDGPKGDGMHKVTLAQFLDIFDEVGVAG